MKLYAQSIFAYYTIVVVFNQVLNLLNGPRQKYKEDPYNKPTNKPVNTKKKVTFSVPRRWLSYYFMFLFIFVVL